MIVNLKILFILVVSDTPKFIDFIEIDRFDSIISSYLVNLYNYINTKKKEIQVDLFIPLMSCKYGKKINGLMRLKYLFNWSGMSLFQVKGSDVGQNLQFNICNYLFWYFYGKILR